MFRPSSVFDQPTAPSLEGCLHKLKHKRSVFGSWTKRYFIVNQDRGRIEYYRIKPQTLAKGVKPVRSIDLSDVKSVCKFEGNTFQIAAGDYVLFLKADSAAEHAYWVQGLRKLLEQCANNDSISTTCDTSSSQSELSCG